MACKQQLFDIQLVNEMIVAAIILYLTEKGHTDIDEDNIADFVLKNSPQIVASITNVDDNGNVET